MNKNYKVIKINGFRGILTAIFVIGCAAAGFIIFPGWMCMNIWNALVSQTSVLPAMSLLHGSILWAIIALSIYALNNNRSLVGFSSHPVLSEEQIKDIMDRVKKNTKNHTNPLEGQFEIEQNESLETLESLESLEEVKK